MEQIFESVNKILFSKIENTGEDGSSIIDLQNFLQEHWKEVKVIEKQLQTCLKDHEVLRKHSTNVVDENRRLLNQLKDKCVTESGSNDLLKLEESILIRNLQQQLALTANERDTVKEMWLLSSKTIDDLQTDLARCKDQLESKPMFKQIDTLQRDYSDAIGLLEKKLSNVKEELDKQQGRSLELENKIKHLQREVDETREEKTHLQSKLSATSKQNEELRNTCFSFESKNARLELLTNKRLSGDNTFVENKELQKLKEERKEMQKALEQCHQSIAILSKQSSTGREKVEEAVQLLEDAISEKDSALSRAVQAEGECLRLQMEIKKLIDEAGAQVGRELAANKEQYSNKVMSLEMELKIAKQDSANKSAEIIQLNKECKRLENSAMQANLAPDKTKLEKKLDRLFGNLHVLQETNLQIMAENDTLKKSLESLYERYRRCKIEKAMYSEQLVLMEAEVESLTKELEAANRSISSFSIEIQNMNLKSSQGHGNEDDQLQEKLQEIQDKNMSTTRELHKHVEAHNNVAKKWRNEMEALTDKLETKLQKKKSNVKKEKKISKKTVTLETPPDD